jgi:hypothetical protein
MHGHNLANGVFQVPACRQGRVGGFAFCQKVFADVSKVFDHQLIYCKQTKIEVVLVG